MNRTTTALVNISDLTTSPVALSPLFRPLGRLAEDLNSLVRDGQLQSVKLDLKHLDCPCFLLRVAPNKPQFYVEIFLGELDDAFVDDAFDEDEEVDGEAVPLCVLMNWLDSAAEPAYWETDWEADLGEEPDFGEVLSHILFMTEAHEIVAKEIVAQEGDVRPKSHDTIIK